MIWRALIESVVIFVTFLVFLLGPVWWMDHHEPAYLPGPPFAPDPEPGYGPFPVDTGPLLIVSETTAAGVALEREIHLRCQQADELIGPVQ